MSRVMTFSRVYPSYHPKAGQPTYFVEKILRSQITDEYMSTYYHNMEVLRSFGGYDIIGLNLKPLETFTPKHHTIRAGHRWKAGDWFSPRVWSGQPYRSKQIQFAPDIQVKKVWNIEMRFEQTSPVAIIENRVIMFDQFKALATNDGLLPSDMMAWFNKTMHGQIICWNESIEY